MKFKINYYDNDKLISTFLIIILQIILFCFFHIKYSLYNFKTVISINIFNHRKWFLENQPKPSQLTVVRINYYSPVWQ